MADTLTITKDHERTLWVELVTAETRKALSKKVSDLNWQGEAVDSAELLRAYKIERGQWCGVVVMGAYRDV